MPFESIRGYLQLASGLVEVTRAKATEAAMSLLTLPSTLSGGTLSTQAQDLAEELMAAATANRSNLIALVRSEVEKAVAKASLMPLDELDRARAGMAKLSSDVEELRDEVLAMPAVRAVPGVSEMSTMLGVRPGRRRVSSSTDSVVGGAVVSGPAPLDETSRTPAPPPVPSAVNTPTKKALAKRAVSKKAVSKKAVAPGPVSEPAVTRASVPVRRARTAKKAATPVQAKTAPAKKATSNKATSKKATTKKAATKKAATKRAAAPATARKATTAKAARRKAAPSKQAATTKKAATTKATGASR